MYLLMIRPQQKRAKETQNMLSSLGKGDSIVTIGAFTAL
ncbi:MAG: preprotein translocase subunit YajC [Alkalibacterium thalassium]|nr:preprotein translocase subunit YajC [Alkalibacterium thalassium]